MKYEEKLFLAMVVSAVFFGIQLMVLEGIKNMILISYLDSIIVESPLLNTSYSLRLMWDMALLGSFINFCLTVTLAHLLGKRMWRNERPDKPRSN